VFQALVCICFFDLTLSNTSRSDFETVAEQFAESSKLLSKGSQGSGGPSKNDETDLINRKTKTQPLQNASNIFHNQSALSQVYMIEIRIHAEGSEAY